MKKLDSNDFIQVVKNVHECRDHLEMCKRHDAPNGMKPTMHM